MLTLAIGLLFFLLIGAIAGFLSGLLGIGGGVIVVPALSWVFSHLALAVPDNAIMHVAAGTSLAAMIITATAATFSHHKHRNVDWRAWKKLFPGSIVGVAAGAWVASLLNTRDLSIIFGIFLLFISSYIYFNARKKEDIETINGNKTLAWPFFVFVGFLIGICSGMLGVGGGVLIIPFLLFLKFPINRVSGTSAALVLPLAIVGTVSFIVTGHASEVSVPYGTGFVYWPAFLGVAMGSVFFVSLGTWAGKQWNKQLLQRIFAFLLLLVALELFF